MAHSPLLARALEHHAELTQAHEEAARISALLNQHLSRVFQVDVGGDAETGDSHRRRSAESCTCGADRLQSLARAHLPGKPLIKDGGYSLAVYGAMVFFF